MRRCRDADPGAPARTGITVPASQAPRVQFAVEPGRVVGRDGVDPAGQCDVQLLGPVDGPGVELQPGLANGLGGGQGQPLDPRPDARGPELDRGVESVVEGNSGASSG